MSSANIKQGRASVSLPGTSTRSLQQKKRLYRISYDECIKCITYIPLDNRGQIDLQTDSTGQLESTRTTTVLLEA